MSSAVKFVLATAILALAGGYVLTGAMTQRPSEEPMPVSTRRPRHHHPFDAGPRPSPSAPPEADGHTDRRLQSENDSSVFPDEVPGRGAIGDAEDTTRTCAVVLPPRQPGHPARMTSCRSPRHPATRYSLARLGTDCDWSRLSSARRSSGAPRT